MEGRSGGPSEPVDGLVRVAGQGKEVDALRPLLDERDLQLSAVLGLVDDEGLHRSPLEERHLRVLVEAPFDQVGEVGHLSLEFEVLPGGPERDDVDRPLLLGDAALAEHLDPGQEQVPRDAALCRPVAPGAVSASVVDLLRQRGLRVLLRPPSRR